MAKKCDDKLVLLLKINMMQVVREDGNYTVCEIKEAIALFMYFKVLNPGRCYSPMLYVHSYSHSLTNIVNVGWWVGWKFTRSCLTHSFDVSVFEVTGDLCNDDWMFFSSVIWERFLGGKKIPKHPWTKRNWPCHLSLDWKHLTCQFLSDICFNLFSIRK